MQSSKEDERKWDSPEIYVHVYIAIHVHVAGGVRIIENRQIMNVKIM